MKKRLFYKNTVRNIVKILKVLKRAEKEGELLTISKIAKMTGLHKWTVSRTIDLHMSNFVDVLVPEHFEDIGMQLKVVKLKDPEINLKTILRYLAYKKRLRL
ncbi:MAG TPA: hypothetical protein ENG42_03285 [Candidatus Aenigmarchaeota archaeon]|nr:MAG: hypothetical protein DRP03_02730 [Candidatus Aenigmarchaeota archaeon]HDD46475.1 hypothetical protein [Candidatus Aenigmarchaeota archaeon]